MSTSIQWLIQWLANQLRKQRRRLVFSSIVMVCSLMGWWVSVGLMDVDRPGNISFTHNSAQTATGFL